MSEQKGQKWPQVWVSRSLEGTRKQGVRLPPWGPTLISPGLMCTSLGKREHVWGTWSISRYTVSAQ